MQDIFQFQLIIILDNPVYNFCHFIVFNLVTVAHFEGLTRVSHFNVTMTYLLV